MKDHAGKIITGVIALVWVVFFLWLGLWRFNIPFNLSSVGVFLYYVTLVMVAPATIFLFGWALDNDWSMLWLLIPVVVGVLAFAICSFVSGAMLNASRLASQITIPDPEPFTEGDIAPFDATQIPWVDEQYAKVLGDKPLGTLGAIGSSVELGEYVRQDVGGKLYFVAPILHVDYWKYRVSPEGTPGYVMVSMTDDSDVRLVDDYRIRVQPDGHAAWGDKLERIVQGLAPFGLRYECKFEVDDELHPWWVVPIYEKQIGVFSGAEIVQVAIVDATDGRNAKLYDLDEVPEWVDRIYPSTLIEEQIANWGKYSGGWMNSWLSKTNLLQSDAGNVVVYSNDDCYLFDSLTSFGGSDESTVGFVLTNMRTKEVHYFALAGATEHAACMSALGDERVKAQNYRAVFPLPTVIEGRPTYFIPLADPNSGIIKSFALVDIEKHQTVGIGTTIREAERDYRAMQRANGSASIYTPTADLIEVNGKILRWGAYTQAGSTYYLFVVEGHEDKLLSMDASATEAPITREGDRVKLQILATENASWSVFSFDNLEFEQDRSELEIIVSDREYRQKLDEARANPAIMDDSKFRDFWDLLTPEQREEFLAEISGD